MRDRKKIIRQLHQITEEKIEYLQGLIEDLRSSNTETKSSMGDKYETSREMLQQEIRQIQSQLLNFQNHQNILNRIKELPSDTIQLGSIVMTSFGNFVVASSLGEFELDGQKFISISEQTPLAQQILGKKSGDSFQINQMTHRIIAIN